VVLLKIAKFRRLKSKESTFTGRIKMTGKCFVISPLRKNGDKEEENTLSVV
jgi:hypothetical protein